MHSTNSLVTVTVIVLCYNQEHTVLQTLNSVKQQVVDFDLEIIIGDDDSADTTRNICEQFIASNAHLRISILPKCPNLGLLENYKRCVFLSKGKYIAAIAGDDYWSDPLKLRKQVAFLELHPNYALVHTNYSVLNVDTGLISPKLTKINPSGMVFNKLLEGNFIGAPTVLVVSTLLKEAIDFGILSESYLMEDYPTWLYLSAKYPIGFLSEDTVVYRQGHNSISSPSNKVKRFLFYNSILQVRTFFFENYWGSDIVFDELIDGHRSHLQKAYELRQLEILKCSFEFLRRHRKVDLVSFKIFIFTFVLKLFRF